MAERILNTKTEKILWATPYIIYAQIGFSTNRQTFNKNFATAEKSPIFTSHKSLYEHVASYGGKQKIRRIWEYLIGKKRKI